MKDAVEFHNELLELRFVCVVCALAFCITLVSGNLLQLCIVLPCPGMDWYGTGPRAFVGHFFFRVFRVGVWVLFESRWSGWFLASLENDASFDFTDLRGIYVKNDGFIVSSS